MLNFGAFIAFTGVNLAAFTRYWVRSSERSASNFVLPLLGALIAWLDSNLPAAEAPVALLWGDPGPHNVLVADGELTALLDWELSHLGHPLDDLGACLWATRGQIDGEQVLQAYERSRGGPVDRTALRWFECLACVSRSVMVIEGMRAFAEGRGPPG